METSLVVTWVAGIATSFGGGVLTGFVVRALRRSRG